MAEPCAASYGKPCSFRKTLGFQQCESVLSTNVPAIWRKIEEAHTPALLKGFGYNDSCCVVWARCEHRGVGVPAIHDDMARDENWMPSRRLQGAAAAERERLAKRLAQLDAEVAALRDNLARAETSRHELTEQLAMLNRLVHGVDGELNAAAAEFDGRPEAIAPAGGAPESTSDEVLRGQAIREAAVRVLVTSARSHEALHYRDWFELLRDAGILPAGKDPLATFLTQLGRSPVVAKSTNQGVYMLDHEFVSRAQQRLAGLTRALRETQLAPVAADPDALANSRQRRTELMADIERTELELEEALRSLGTSAAHQLAAAVRH